jgi:hypothetical protein
MRELSRIGGFIQALTNTPPLLTIYAAVPAEEVLALEVWLTNASKSEGKVVGNEPTN